MYSPITVTESGITKSYKDVSANALLPISVTESGIETC